LSKPITQLTDRELCLFAYRLLTMSLSSFVVRMLFAALLCVTACHAQVLDETTEACTTTTCASGSLEAAKGTAMLQVQKTAPEDAPKGDSYVAKEQSETMACSLERAQQEPLTEEGFATVSKSCCYEDLKTYTRRVIDDLGWKVCDEGGLSGLAPFFACPNTPVTLEELKAELNKAMPSGNSKCHWLDERYTECTDPALECSVSAQRPKPAPKPVATGFIAFKATNPSEMVRSSKAIDVMKHELSLALSIDETYVNVVIGSGPLDGEEVVSSFLLIPDSQAFYSATKGTSKVKLCKVFAVYSIQEPAKPANSLTTAAPSLNEADIVNRLKQMDNAALGAKMTQDLVDVDKVIGTVEVMEETICEKTTGKCTHEVIQES